MRLRLTATASNSAHLRVVRGYTDTDFAVSPFIQ